jgi:hypothetical protein
MQSSTVGQVSTCPLLSSWMVIRAVAKPWHCDITLNDVRMNQVMTLWHPTVLGSDQGLHNL